MKSLDEIRKSVKEINEKEALLPKEELFTNDFNTFFKFTLNTINKNPAIKELFEILQTNLSEYAKGFYKDQLQDLLQRYETTPAKKDFLMYHLKLNYYDSKELSLEIDKPHEEIIKIGYLHGLNQIDFKLWIFVDPSENLTYANYGKSPVYFFEGLPLFENIRNYPITEQGFFNRFVQVIKRFKTVAKGYAKFLLSTEIQTMLNELENNEKKGNQLKQDTTFSEFRKEYLLSKNIEYDNKDLQQVQILATDYFEEFLLNKPFYEGIYFQLLKIEDKFKNLQEFLVRLDIVIISKISDNYHYLSVFELFKKIENITRTPLLPIELLFTHLIIADYFEEFVSNKISDKTTNRKIDLLIKELRTKFKREICKYPIRIEFKTDTIKTLTNETGANGKWWLFLLVGNDIINQNLSKNLKESEIEKEINTKEEKNELIKAGYKKPDENSILSVPQTALLIQYLNDNKILLTNHLGKSKTSKIISILTKHSNNTLRQNLDINRIEEIKNQSENGKQEQYGNLKKLKEALQNIVSAIDKEIENKEKL